MWHCLTALSIVMHADNKNGYVGSSFTNYAKKKLNEKSEGKPHKTERSFANAVSA